MEKPGPSEAPLVAAVVRTEPASEYRLFADAIRDSTFDMPQSPFRNRPLLNEDEVSWLHTDRTFSASYNVSATTHACSSR